MRRPRFRMRALLIAVAVAGVSIGGVRLWQRQRLCRTLADQFAAAEPTVKLAEQELQHALETCEDSLAEARRRERDYGPEATATDLPRDVVLELMACRVGTLGDLVRHREYEVRESRAIVTWMAREAAYLAQMRRKYQRAARSPWLPLAPDPPDPRWQMPKPSPPPIPRPPRARTPTGPRRRSAHIA